MTEALIGATLDRMLTILTLIRWHNCLMASLCVVLGARIMRGSYDQLDLILSATATFLVCAAGNIVNDIFDVDIDRVNRPNRVFPSGALSVSTGAVIAGICTMLAIVMSITVSQFVAVLAVTISGLLFLYNAFLKQLPLAGNLTIAFAASCTLLAGGMVVSPSRAITSDGVVIPFVLSFILHLTREIVKDIEDIDGDTSQGHKTLPAVIGRRPALVVALAVFALLPATLLSSAGGRWFGEFLATMLAVVLTIPLTVLTAIAIVKLSSKALRQLSLGIKLCMIVGMASLLCRFN